MYHKSTNFGDYYKMCILKMLLSYGEYEYADEAELDGYREALHKMVDIFISDYREYNEYLDEKYEEIKGQVEARRKKENK